MRKKTIALLLAAAMAISIAATGCNQAETESKTPAQSGQTGSASESESIVTEPGTFPIVEEPYELDVFFTRDAPPANWDVETNWFTKEYEEMTGVHVNWEMVIGDTAQRAQKVNLKLTSGQYPDVFSKCTISRSQQVMYGKQGIFLPLNDLIDNHTVNIKKMFEEVPNAKDEITTPDGNIYGLPDVVLFVHGTVPNKMWINQTWLDKLGLEMPTTTDEYYDVLKAFKDNDPNGNGQADEIPLVSQGLDIAFLMNSFIYFDATYTMMDGNTVTFIGDKEEYKEGLKYLKKLVDDGLYAADSLTMDRQQRTSLVMSDDALVGSATALWPGHFATVESEVDDDGATRFWEYKAVAPLEGPNGVRQTVYNGGTITNGGAEFNITSACEHPEVAIRWVDYFYDMEGFNTASYGPKITSEDELVEGVAGWREAKDGEVGADGEKALFYPYGLNNEVNCGWQTGQVVPRYQSFAAHTGMTVPADGHYEQMLYDVTVNDYWPYKAEDSVPPLYMEDDVASEFAELQTMLVDYCNEAASQFITGVRDIDAEWDSYLDELNRLGLERFLEIYQASYDQNYKK